MACEEGVGDVHLGCPNLLQLHPDFDYDGSGDVVVRFHEACGGRTRATLTAGFEAAAVSVTDLLERPLADATAPEADRGAAAPVRADDAAAAAAARIAGDAGHICRCHIVVSR
ncbi:hypothetical protein GCM10010313_07940 [Streptomyces violarus]|nr:hypothetical protein GCM10010313_07940 [Streptomyces violarus]